MGWGDEETVRARLRPYFTDVRVTRRIAVMQYPFTPAGTVEFFSKYYGPTVRAFASLRDTEREVLRGDLVELQAMHNSSSNHWSTEVYADYLDVVAVRR